MRNKVYEKIATHQNTINNLEKVYEMIEKSETEDIRVVIETKHWYGFSEPFLSKHRSRIETDKKTMKSLIVAAIGLEESKMDDLLEKEV